MEMQDWMQMQLMSTLLKPRYEQFIERVKECNETVKYLNGHKILSDPEICEREKSLIQALGYYQETGFYTNEIDFTTYEKDPKYYDYVLEKSKYMIDSLMKTVLGFK